MKIKSIHIYYSDCKKTYDATITVGTEKTSLEFKLNDQQTRELLRPLTETICEACAVNAEEIKRQIVAELEVKGEGK